MESQEAKHTNMPEKTGITAPDKKWVKVAQRAMKGNLEAAESLVRHHYREILYFSMKKVGWQDAEDVAQQSVIKILAHITTLKEPTKYRSWLLSLTRFTCIDFVRQKTSGINAMLEQGNYTEEEMHNIKEIQQEFLPEEAFLQEESRQLVVSLLDALPEHYALCLRLYYYDGLSYKEIAEVLDIKLEKVQGNMRRGVEMLRRRYEESTHTQVRYSIAALGALPVLSRILEAESSAYITPELLNRFSENVQASLASGVTAAGLAAGGTSSVAASSGEGAVAATSTLGHTAGHGIGIAKAAGLALAGIALVGAGIGVGLSMGHVPNTAQLQADSAPVQQQANEPNNSVAQMHNINTLEDMIGAQEEAVLYSYELQGTDVQSLQSFVEGIGAQASRSSEREGSSYVMYVLEKQDKQLLLFTKQSLGTSEIELHQQFRPTQQLPSMFEVAYLFE